jgi:hypothetical protein
MREFRVRDKKIKKRKKGENKITGKNMIKLPS